jgi:tetratricopeptide (TPR) repeat protein
MIKVTCGWMAYDASDFPLARQLLSDALVMARDLDDSQTAVQALAHLSLLNLVTGRPREAVDFAAAGLRIAPSGPHQSLLALRQARAWAMAGDSVAFRTKLHAATRLMDRTDDDAPAWLGFYGPAEVVGNEGICLLRLGQPARAAGLLRNAADGQGPSRIRNRAFYLALTAQAEMLAGDIEQGISTANEGIELLGDRVTSSRTMSEFRRFRHLLKTARSLPAAGRDFLAQHFDNFEAIQ